MFWNKKKEDPKFVVVDCVNNCLRDKCPKWVVLNHKMVDDKGKVTNVPEGKCAQAWLPSLIIELTEAIKKGK